MRCFRFRVLLMGLRHSMKTRHHSEYRHDDGQFINGRMWNIVGAFTIHLYYTTLSVCLCVCVGLVVVWESANERKIRDTSFMVVERSLRHEWMSVSDVSWRLPWFHELTRVLPRNVYIGKVEGGPGFRMIKDATRGCWGWLGRHCLVLGL